MHWERIENYRNKTGKTWPEVAQDLGIGKSMLMMVKTGKRSLSSKVIYRLTEAEKTAGIQTPLDKLLQKAADENMLALPPNVYALTSKENDEMFQAARPQLENIAKNFEKSVLKMLQDMQSKIDALNTSIADLQKQLKQKEQP